MVQLRGLSFWAKAALSLSFGLLVVVGALGWRHHVRSELLTVARQVSLDQAKAAQGDESAQRALGLRGMRLGYWEVFSLSITILVWMQAFKTSRLITGRGAGPQTELLRLALAFGLTFLGLQVYGAIAVFPTMLALSVFSAVRISCARAALSPGICVNGEKAARAFLFFAIALFVSANLFAFPHVYRFPSFAGWRGFYGLQGLGVGVLVPAGVFLWLSRKRMKRAMA